MRQAASAGTHLLLWIRASGGLAIAYHDETNGDLKLWVDDGEGGGISQNGVADGNEVRTLDSSGNVGHYTDIVVDANGYLAVSYEDVGNGDLKIWLDDGAGGGIAGNRIADGGEVRVVDASGSDSGSPTGSHTSIAVDASGALAVAYHSSAFGDLRLWLDNGAGGGIAGNGFVDGAEIKNIDFNDFVGTSTDILLNASGQLVISYHDGTTANRDLKLWVDDGNGGGIAGNGIADGAEIRTVQSVGDVGRFTSLALDKDDNIAIAYQDFTNDATNDNNLNLWIDDGAGGGTAGNLIADGSEVRVIDALGNTGFEPQILLYGETLAIAYFDDTLGDLILWVDDGFGGGTAQNGIADGAELRTPDSAGRVGDFPSITVDAFGNLAVSYWDISNLDLKLLRAYNVPEIDITGNSVSIENGDSTPDAADNTDFGSQSVASGASFHTFTINNSGTGVLHLGANAVSILGVNAADFTVSSQPATTLGNSGSTSFTITFDPLGGGCRTAAVQIANNDKDESPYTFSILGLGEDPAMPPTIESTGDVGEFNTVFLDANDHLNISYYEYTTGAHALKLWADDGFGGGVAGDRIRNGCEIRTIELGGKVGNHAKAVLTSAGHVAITYRDDFTGNTDLRLWIDDGRNGGIAGDKFANGGEIRIIDPTVPSGARSDITIDSNDHLAISYTHDLTQDAYLWLDDGAGGGIAGDGVANGSEVKPIYTGQVQQESLTGIGLTASNHLVVSFVAHGAKDLMIWVDDGTGGGTAADGIPDSGEVRTIRSAGAGHFQSNAQSSDKDGNLAIANHRSTASPTDQIELWVDDGAGGGTAGDFIVNGDEVRFIHYTDRYYRELSLTNSADGIFGLSFKDEQNSRSLSYWVDDGSGGGIAGDLQVNGAELRNAATGVQSGVFSSILLYDDDKIAVAHGTETTGDLLLETDTFQPASPEIAVLGNSTEIPDGNTSPSTADHTDFGTADVSSSAITRTFTIRNSGASVLTLGANAVSVSGANTADFNITAQPAVTVAASGGTTTFTVSFDPSAGGIRSATLSVNNDDSDENPYDFAIQGHWSECSRYCGSW